MQSDYVFIYYYTQQSVSYHSTCTKGGKYTFKTIPTIFKVSAVTINKEFNYILEAICHFSTHQTQSVVESELSISFTAVAVDNWFNHFP